MQIRPIYLNMHNTKMPEAEMDSKQKIPKDQLRKIW